MDLWIKMDLQPLTWNPLANSPVSPRFDNEFHHSNNSKCSRYLFSYFGQYICSHQKFRFGLLDNPYLNFPLLKVNICL
ncbi:hypothetical protein CDAR_488991 [Caerostris darwini]|uniref:Uncharacterized protein n=1 Tax=Caerostris darwini TaxID=1538125 RepID=A0AAV4VIR5_9ARAC|nr:hypothetical protein CDAR_488991 [Caerostris darwini]